MANRTLLLFDLDGTLLDSAEMILECQRLAFTAIGLPVPSRERGLSIVGLSLREAFVELVGEHGPVEDLAEAYRQSFHALRMQGAELERLFPGVKPLLAELAASEPHCLGIATGKSQRGVRAVLERASARETAARVAAGGLARQLLGVFGIEVAGWGTELGGVVLGGRAGTLPERRAVRDTSAIYSLHPDKDPEVTALIDRVGKEGDTLGGIVEVRVDGLPIGLGTHAQWDRKLDGRLAQAVMAVQAIKGVEIGMGFEAARRRGSEVHDPIHYDPAARGGPQLGFTRPTNNAGGLEAGTTNGQPLVVKAAMKPIATLRKPLESVNLASKQPEEAAYERSDVCAVSACSVIVENVVAFEVAAALVDKFGGDSIAEMKARWDLYHEMARGR